MTTKAQQELGAMITELRTRSGMTQQELATAAGITQAQLALVENGIANSTITKLSKICEALSAKLIIASN
jgi:transcriptional regulator with XRE-family HTH domain